MRHVTTQFNKVSPIYEVKAVRIYSAAEPGNMQMIAHFKSACKFSKYTYTTHEQLCVFMPLASFRQSTFSVCYRLPNEGNEMKKEKNTTRHGRRKLFKTVKSVHQALLSGFGPFVAGNSLWQKGSI